MKNDAERIKEILSEPQKFVGYTTDHHIIIKKKEDLKGVSREKVGEQEAYYLAYWYEFIPQILNALNIETLKPGVK